MTFRGWYGWATRSRLKPMIKIANMLKEPFLMNDHCHRYFHAVWHLLVMLASACDYAAIAMFVILQADGHQ